MYYFSDEEFSINNVSEELRMVSKKAGLYILESYIGESLVSLSLKVDGKEYSYDGAEKTLGEELRNVLEHLGDAEHIECTMYSYSSIEQMFEDIFDGIASPDLTYRCMLRSDGNPYSSFVKVDEEGRRSNRNSTLQTDLSGIFDYELWHVEPWIRFEIPLLRRLDRKLHKAFVEEIRMIYFRIAEDEELFEWQLPYIDEWKEGEIQFLSSFRIRPEAVSEVVEHFDILLEMSRKAGIKVTEFEVGGVPTGKNDDPYATIEFEKKGWKTEVKWFRLEQ